jgi:SecD/SecF fusion protein
MQRNFLRGLLICLIPCLVAALFAARPEKYRLGIDLAGGTILVYEVNVDRTAQRKATEQGSKDGKDKDKDKAKDGPAPGLSSDEMNQLAAQIKRRIDPTDIKNVTVRPSGDRRVEIILPTGGTTGGKAGLSSEDVEEVKRLISQMGVLEFRILANGPDDKEGIRDAIRDIEKAAATKSEKWVDFRKPEPRNEEDGTPLQKLAARGLAPAPPDSEFNVDINDTKAAVKYAWVELGPEERESLGLSNASGATSPLWVTLAGARDSAVPIQGQSRTDALNCNMVIYSRECVSAETLTKESETYKRLKAEQAAGTGTGAGKTDEEIEALVNRKKVEYFALTRVSEADNLKVGGDITITANSSTDKSYNLAVEFRFNGAGGQQFGKVTRRNKPTGGHQRRLAIVLDERIVSAPNLHGEIGNVGQITGGEKGFDRKTVDRLVQILRSGALSAELREKPVSENTIGPTLGADTIKRGTRAVGLAFLAILAFMVIYYRFAGFVACVALFANLLLTVGFMVAVNAAFTLPGLAGLVLTLGMAVDANVLIYERLREERNKGANLATAIRNGYDRAFLTIIDTHLTSIFTSIVLYTLGNDNLKGFAISLAVGLIISLFTSLYMTRLMFDFWQHKKWLTELRMMRLFEKPSFNPMKYRWFFFPFTAAITVIGLGLFLVRGDQGLNVDFRGGTVFAGRLKDNEERGLTKTADGKPGFRELLGEENQKKRLAVKAGAEGVVWNNKPVGDVPVNTWDYTITYEDGTRVPVTLTEKPAGKDDKEMADDVRARASRLPDVSVEQTFLSTDNFQMGKSKRFTVRTTEKQPALVRATLDRLMRTDDNKTLFDGATLTPGPVTGAVVELSFDKPTSLAFTTELFNRAFKNELSTDSGPDTFALTGVGEPVDGRFTKMKLDVGRNPTLDKLRGPAPAAGAPGAAERAAQLKGLAQVVNAAKAAFDGTPEPERLEVFDSQLAKETREKALFAIVVSWIAILMYLWFRFGNWTFGLASVICLLHDLCFTLGAIAACHYLHLIPGANQFLLIEDFKIDLAAVAALLTLVGYSVNEIIVNFARVREVRGKNPQLTPQMINDSVNQTLSRTILTSMTVLLVSIVLYAFGGEGVHLFAFVMMIGVLISTYSSIFVACPLLLFLGEGRDTAGAAADQPSSTDDKEEGAEQEEVVEG